MKKILLDYLEKHYNNQGPYTKGELFRMILSGEITSKQQLIDDLKVV